VFETYVAEWNKLRDVARDTAKAASEPIQARFAARGVIVGCDTSKNNPRDGLSGAALGRCH
jgi:hypothetical protein